MKRLNIRKSILQLCAVVAGIVCLLPACRKEYLSDKDAELTFSNDTVYFDTTLTQLGTRTEQLVVRNPYKKKILVDEISIRGGSASEYLINVNGVAKDEARDIEIGARDSIYIFVQAKLDKNNSDTLGFHPGELVFSHNNKEQVVKLVAWGKDAEALSGKRVTTTTWAAGKSFYITDSLVVEEGCTLTIEEGVNVYFRPNANFIVNGTLVVNGSVKKPVVFQGYRLEYYYQQNAGQWGSIIFGAKSSGNRLSNMSISNGTTSIMLREREGAQAEIALENVRIENMSYAGILCSNARITAVNCVIADCNEYALKISNGGTYSFIHTTISNYDNSSTRLSSSLYATNTSDDESKATNALKLEMINSIVVGTLQDEIETVKNDGAGFDVSFKYCLVRQAEKNQYMDDSTALLQDNTHLFRDIKKDFELDSTSVARDKGDKTVADQHPTDMNGRSRTEDQKPDLGAYEYYKKDEDK